MHSQLFNSISGYPANILYAFVIVAVAAITFPMFILLTAGVILIGVSMTFKNDTAPSLRKTTPVVIWLLFFELIVIVVNGLFMKSGEPLVIITSSLTLWEGGLAFGLRAFTRLFFLSSGILFLFRLAPPDRVARSILRANPTSLMAQLLLLSVYYIAMFPRKLSLVSDSQKARGADLSGSLMTRLRLFLPVLFPVLISSLEEVIERGIVIQQRGLFERRGTTTKVKPNQLTLLLAVMLIGMVLYGLW